MVTRDSLRITRGRITRSQLRAVYAEQEVRELREFWVTDRLEILELRSQDKTDMTKQDIKASRAMAEATEQQAKTLQVSLGAAQMDVRDLIESHETYKLEMAELQSRAQDIKVSFWDLKRHLAQQVANAIETIAIYEAKTRVAHDLMKQVKRQEDKVADNSSNKRKWEGDYGRSSSQQ
ncbi:hypothetical protein Tco_0893245 [Tanacetum coccineum]|uniref:Uncharacterized protein n=1 Tax=Tanacetum coccineum TaxID=301880 RepID=A0ABQ5CBC8_9ASTR